MNLIKSAVFSVNDIEYVVTVVWNNNTGISLVEFKERNHPHRSFSMNAKEFLNKTNPQFLNDNSDLHKFYATKYKEHNQHPLKA